MVAGLLLTLLLSACRSETTIVVVAPTLTPTPRVSESVATATPNRTVPSNTPSKPSSPTPTVQSFTKADQVIDASKTKYRAILKTTAGDITIDLNADAAPNTVNSFVFLAQKGFFDDTTFWRVQPDFVIQGGDPTGTGTGGPGYSIRDEPNQVRNTKYTISMAKGSGASAFGSQFFINLKDNPALDYDNGRGDKFYPFGAVTSGQDVVDAIGKAQTKVGTDGLTRPVSPVKVTTVVIETQPK